MKTYKNDEGVYIHCNMGSAITGATNLSFHYKKPDGSTGYWTPVMNSSTVLEYQITTGELDQTGTWLVQPYLELGDFKGRGETSSFTVYDEFE